MKRTLLLLLAALLPALSALPAFATDLSTDSILLVAKRQLQDKLYGSSILIARPIGADRHVGFIVNRPTKATLGSLFPGHEPSRKVAEPVYLGGPVSSEVIFAMVQGNESPGGRSIKILDDLYLAIDGEVVDRVIEKQPARARFFAGMVLWKPGELADEIKQGLWYVNDAKADVVLRKSTDGMWEELLGRSERRANAI
jgi:putative AlgH/UPF0301 family transcriptional regulator